MKNRVLLFAFLFTLALGIISFYSYYKFYKNTEKKIDKIIVECKSNIEAYSFCEDYLKKDRGESTDVYTVFYKIVNEEQFYYMVYIGPLIIMIPSAWCISKEIKNSYLKNYLTRNNYKSYIKHLILSAYKPIWIIPTIVFVLFILTHLITNNYDYSTSLANSYSTFDEIYLQNFTLFLLIYLIIMTIFSAFYANLTLLFVKKNKSTIVCIIESYIAFIGIEIINEVLITGFFYKILHVRVQSLFNILDIYTFES